MRPPRFQLSAAAAVLYPLLLFLDSDGLAAALLPAVLCHEAGHWLALRACGARVTEVRLDAAGICLVTTGLTGRGQEVICALAGPAAGVGWAVLAARLGGRWVSSAGLSALLSVYNLLPALPLDGARALLALTGRERALRVLGVVAAAVLLAAALRWRAALLYVPALWLLGQNLIPLWRAVFPSRAAPAGISAPARRPARGRWRPV